MSAHTLLAEAGCHIQHGCAFPAPGLNSFDFKPIFSVGSFDFTKPMLLAIICMLLVVGFFWAAFRKPKLVPGKLQLVGEIGYTFVARSIAREVIGKKGDKYVPFLTSIFFFVWLMNIMSIIPVAQFPATSRFAFPVGLAALVFITYMYLTFKNNGFRGGIKNLVWIDGLPWPLVPLIVVLEFFSNVILRPFTLAVRLWANMFAGHMLIVMFSVASWYLLTPSLFTAVSGASFIIALLMTTLEVLIQFLQAYIFTLLASIYIQGALEEGH
ncbi:putative ATP synthase A chain [Actinacidiphila reveromycinica]|uniref:ATP synthase subunit a n=1 Tax=Actinacidiphila reveromycinica TaxID=659352 RepID=A0A7U3UX23_9ACTN|nr:F0F1 ATP synthase subunit A [Streptomyces sp. SN-593]BBB00217.1 putative ATP synthase A chain [Streptomyces sp. SN-593]